MKPSKEQIAELIDKYLKTEGATNVMNRHWGMMFIHRLHRENYPNQVGKASEIWKNTINDKRKELSKYTSFDKLYKAIMAIKVHGIGELSKYDTATCIGCEQCVFPQVVYLHVGTAEGAREIGIKGKTATKEQFVKICDAFERLEPIQIEDFLCIYKEQLSGKNQESHTGCCG